MKPAMDSLILALLLVSAISLETLAQEVDIRSIADKLDGGDGDGGSQTRNIYQQARHQSPHRIMHFGKRPFLDQESAFSGILPAAKSVDLFQQQQQLEHSQLPETQSLPVNKYPFLLSIELERGQTLQELPEEMTAYEFLEPHKGLLYNIEQRSAEANGARLSRLTSNEVLDSGNLSGSKPDSDAVAGGEPPRQQEQAIDVSTRAYQRPSNINKAVISRLLFGQNHLSSPLPGFGSSYIKKAEPKDNLFMHFGRK